jgi:hypothetical protein
VPVWRAGGGREAHRPDVCVTRCGARRDVVELDGSDAGDGEETLVGRDGEAVRLL